MRQQKQRAHRPWMPATQREYTRSAILATVMPARPALRAFAAWLEDERELEPASITVRTQSARWFIEAIMTVHDKKSAAGAFRSLTVDDIEEFFVGYSKDHGTAARRSMRSAMRLLLQFAASRSWVAETLAETVPSMHGYRLSGVPRAISEEDLRTLIGSIQGTGPSARDRRSGFCSRVTAFVANRFRRFDSTMSIGTRGPFASRLTSAASRSIMRCRPRSLRLWLAIYVKSGRSATANLCSYVCSARMFD